MQRHNENGLAVARFLGRAIRGSRRSIIPACASHPYYEVARRTMRGFGGLVTFLVRDADWRADGGAWSTPCEFRGSARAWAASNR